MALSVLGWTLRELAAVRQAVIDPTGTAAVAISRADVALDLLDAPPLDGVVAGAMPTPGEIRAVQAEGQLWRKVAAVCYRLRQLHDAPATARLALELLAPDPDYAWRLFHLGVLGELLLALRGAGADVVSLRPLGSAASGSPGPAFRVTDAEGRLWDLWFEGAGAWASYGVPEPYMEFAAAVPGPTQPLGPDLLLIRRDERALVLECKFSNTATYIARDGYHQIVAYVSEAAYLVGGDASGYVVGPSDVIRRGAEVESAGGPVGLTPPEDLAVIVEATLTPHDGP